MADEVWSAEPMAARSGANPNIDTQKLNPYIEIFWMWPVGEWEKFRIVRNARSPAVRVEEGRRIMECWKGQWTEYASDGRARLRDENPIPNEWNFYTAFALGADRVWKPVGTIADVGIGDFQWQTRLPEFMPGAAISTDKGVMEPGGQGSLLVNFMQPMGVAMNRLQAMSDATRLFLDPMRCAPKMLPLLVSTYGWQYAGTPTISRIRAVAKVVRQPDQGSFPFIDQFIEAGTGCRAATYLSDNLFLNINDSSFENGAGEDDKLFRGWAPIEQYSVAEYGAGDVGVLPANTARKCYAIIKANQLLQCGTYIDQTKLKTDPAFRVFDPVRAGVPCAGWTMVRMSCIASLTSYDSSGNLTLGVDLYDHYGQPVDVGGGTNRITVFETSALNNSWAPYGNSYDLPVSIPTTNHAYAVPWMIAGQDCLVDLLVLDDGV